MSQPGSGTRSAASQPATAADIRAMVGDVDDDLIARIMATEATAAEVLQAVQWMRGGGGLEDEAGHAPHGAVRAVYELLQAEEPEEP